MCMLNCSKLSAVIYSCILDVMINLNFGLLYFKRIFFDDVMELSKCIRSFTFTFTFHMELVSGMGLPTVFDIV